MSVEQMQTGLKNHILALYMAFQETHGLNQTQAKILLLSMLEKEHQELIASLDVFPPATKNNHIRYLLDSLSSHVDDEFHVPLQKTADWIASLGS